MDQNHILQTGLGNQQTVKRITMMKWKGRYRQSMLMRNLKRA